MPLGFGRLRDAEAEALERSLQHAAGSYQDRPWLNGIFRPLLIALVATSLAAGPLALLRSLTAWPLAYTLPLIFVLTVEGIYSTRQLGRPTWRQKRGLGFRLGELALLLVVVRLAVWWFGTGWPSAGELRRWLDDPGRFFDGQFLWLAAITCTCWLYAARMTLDFMDLAIQPDEMLARENRLQLANGGADHAQHDRSRSEIMGGFVARWIWAAIVMVFLAALTRLSVRTGEQGLLRITLQGAGLGGDVLVALLTYFLAGFILISEARLAVLRGSWYNEDLGVSPAVTRRWQATALISLLLVGALAGLLPLGSTVGLSYGLGFLLGLLVRLFYFMVAVLIVLFGILLWPFRFLLAAGSTNLPPPNLTLRDMPDQQQAISRLPPWLGGALFWLVVVVVVAYLLAANLRAHGLGLGGGAPNSRFERLRYWWRALWARVRGRVQSAGMALRARVAQLAPSLPAVGGPRPPAVRPNELPPRARLRYFYLSTVQRAAQHGIVRPPHKTPLEFVGELRTQAPDAEDDVEALTEAFIAARYNDQPIPTAQAHTVQPIWQRVMAALGRGNRADR